MDQSIQFDRSTESAAKLLIELALAEDLRDRGDLTSQSTIPAELNASVNLVSRERGVLCGAPLIPLVFEQLESNVRCELFVQDSSILQRGSLIATMSGPVRTLLTAERTILNFMIHLSGVASRTRMFAERVSGTKAVILDTRKTLPGYRLLHKYAVRCGGGVNHRMGLFDGILIKDNHLAARGERSVAGAVNDARMFLSSTGIQLPIEIEVDTLAQLKDALDAKPEIVLLDNMSCDEMSEAVRIRDTLSPTTRLEASGGVTLDTVRAIAETGVDRISIGGLTHSAPALDLGFDWPWSSVPE
jgi:nicotinate-nucleotide pyrophosphorylase (carboxylating)